MSNALSCQHIMSMSDLMVSGYYASLVDMQRDPAKPANYEQALRDYLVVLDQLLARHPRSEVYSTLAFDKTITLARLASLTEQRDGVDRGGPDGFVEPRALAGATPRLLKLRFIGGGECLEIARVKLLGVCRCAPDYGPKIGDVSE